MKLKRLAAFGSSLVLSLSSLFVFAPAVHAATITWDGGGGDNNFSTAANWSGDVVPGTSDDVVFDNTVEAGNQTYNNDLVGAIFNSITFQGNNTNQYTISGNAFSLNGGISNLSQAQHTISAAIGLASDQEITTTNGPLVLSGALNGSGALTKSGNQTLVLSGANTFTGDVTVNGGRLRAIGATGLGSKDGTTIVNDGGDLSLATCSTITVNEDIMLTGASSTPSGDSVTAKLSTVSNCAGGGGADEVYGSGVSTGSVTLDGTISLGSAITFLNALDSATITGPLSGNFAISMLPGALGKLTLNSSANTSATPNGTYSAPVLDKTLTDNQASHSVAVLGNTTLTINGQRGQVTVSSGGTLKGTGTIGAVTINEGATIAPGESPGCLNSGNAVINGTHEVEIGGTTVCTEYDQLRVTGTVDVTGATLVLSRFNDFAPATGQTYTIIDNDGADTVTGTFANLAEGAETEVDGYVFGVSYVGGDGNDVVLTVRNVPGSPDTGFSLVTKNPLVTLLTTSVLAGAIALLARRYKHAYSR